MGKKGTGGNINNKLVLYDNVKRRQRKVVIIPFPDSATQNDIYIFTVKVKEAEKRKRLVEKERE